MKLKEPRFNYDDRVDRTAKGFSGAGEIYGLGHIKKNLSNKTITSGNFNFTMEDLNRSSNYIDLYICRVLSASAWQRTHKSPLVS